MANDNSGKADTKSNAAGDGQGTLMVTEAAFRQREAAIRAITELREGQFDVNAACTRLLGALPQIRGMQVRACRRVST